MNCTTCGHALDDGALVCGQCGAVVGASHAPPPEHAGFPASPSSPASTPPAIAPLRRSAAQVTRLLARVKAIIATPRTEWPVIADEPTPARAIYMGYVAPLAAIGAVALFIAQVLIGTPLPLIGLVRVAIDVGFVGALLTFALAVISVWVLAHLIDALAPQFGGQRDPLRALKLSAYSYTPVWLAGVLHLAPALSMLVVPASLYGLYLLYVGLPVLMRCSPAQAGPYIGLVVGCAVVLYFFFGGLTTCVAGFGPVDFF